MATVPNTPRTNRITLASPSAGPFEVGFRLFSATGLEAFVDGVRSTDWTLTADFTAGYDDAATITFGVSLDTAAVIQIDGAEIPVRSEDYLNPDPGLTRKMNAEMARITAALSDLHMKVGRSIRALEAIDPAEGVTSVDLSNLATYAAEAETARDEVVAIQSTIPRRAGSWLTARAYLFADLVQDSGSTYFCLISHTSGTFSTDLAAAKWELWAQKGAAGAGFGDVVAANNGSDFASAATVRTNLGLAIGTSVQAYNQLLGAVAGLGTTGIMARLSGSAAAARTITGTASQITVTDGDGVAGNPTISAVIASQAEAEAGANTTKLMTAQRVAQAIAELAAGAPVLLASKTASASATLDFTELNNAVYSRYLFVLKALKPATDAVQVIMRLSTDGGATYLAAVGSYSFAMRQRNHSGTDHDGDSNSSINLSLTSNMAGGEIGNAAGEDGVSGDIVLSNAGSAILKTLARFNLSAWDASGRHCVIDGSGAQLTAADTDAVRFVCGSGNIASGVIELWGLI